ncbi:hypothetical protein LTS18_013031 [Coniosporium uncinatum]|uniref:Uncharacterized protein n=1 Tax=Coniosporium uncinatum TaxID=93489 RepID=A0ACC3CXE2_9PEZI|nr:hypothetical protein LTS18_013031 [Coniosporium uncinatum]
MDEVVRSFGVALAKGCKPLRTIVFASWDGEEYGLIGSTERDEKHVAWLKHSAVAYLNVDVGAVGPDFGAAAAPLLMETLVETTKLVISPNQTVVGQTVHDEWEARTNLRINTIGSGSDFTAFQDFAGIPCVDMTFKNGRDSPVYHYHSNYDSFSWMEKYGDPGIKYHVTMARLFSLLAARIAEREVIQFSAGHYAEALVTYLHTVEEMARGNGNKTFSGFTAAEADGITNDAKGVGLIRLAINNFTVAAQMLDYEAEVLQKQVDSTHTPWWRWWDRVKLTLKLRHINDKYKHLERQFLCEEGLDNRSWFKHVVFAPGRHTGYAGATFPGLVESVEDGNKESFQRWSQTIARQIDEATKMLSGTEKS